MAFTKTPAESTYKTQYIEFDGKDSFRSGDLTTARDLQIVNMYYERVHQSEKEIKTVLKKRPGLAATTYSFGKVSLSEVIRGSFYDTDEGLFYWCTDRYVYRMDPNFGTPATLVATFLTVDGHVDFCSYLKSDNTRYVAITDGSKLFLYNTGTSVTSEVVDADMPTPHQPSIVYLNGYLFLADWNTGDIYNSNVDDPTSWTAGDFMTAEMSADYIIRLVRAKNHIVALGSNSIEFFYDAGVATGSPIQRNDSPYRSIGYITGLCTIGDTIFFVGQDSSQNVGVYALNSMQVKKVSNEVVDRTLQVYSSTQNTDANLNLDRNGYSISVDGHNFYVLVGTTTTWAYDFDHNYWYEWKGSDGNGLDIEAAWSAYNGAQYVAIAGKEFISILSPKIYQDFGSNFTTSYVTERTEFGTYNNKTNSRVILHVDRHSTSGSSNVSLYFSDDDYLTWSAARSLDVFSERPTAHQLGRFRTRAYKLTYADNYPLRMYRLEIAINVGGS